MKKLISAAGLILTMVFNVDAKHPELSPDKILFQSGTVSTSNNFTEAARETIPPEDFVDGHYYRLIQFNRIPTTEAQQNLEAKGIKFLGYLPYNAFYVSIDSRFDLNELLSYDVRCILRLSNDQKSCRAIRENNFPDYCLSQNGQLDLMMLYYKDVNPEVILTDLKTINAQVIKTYPDRDQFRLSVPRKNLALLISKPYLKFIDLAGTPSVPEDTRGRSLHRSNLINTELSGGLHYNGEGVSISLADDGEVGPHIDFTGRITQLISTGPGGSHGDMTGGIAVGAGNLDPTKQGMASGAHLYVHDVDDGVNPYDHIYNAPSYYATYGAVITSTSYSQGCNDYNLIASTGDQIVHQNPYMNLVFSAGNNGQSDCGYGTGVGWGTITGGFKQGKNVIACGNLDPYSVLDPTSSRGPSADGRVKPDICSNGKDQNSTRDNNRYQVGGGTSAACPGIAGVTAQLIQAYREMHPGTEAPSALLKSCLLNSAEDIGNPGPDFTYGWGRVNAFRALSALTNQRYLLDSVSNGQSMQHTIQVPANVKQIKCMLYWMDIEGDPAASIALTNDLDMTLTDPSTSVYQPWILDPSPVVASITANAVRGADHLNNMEQVTIDNPPVGNYVVNVSGTSIPAGYQQYYIVWEFETDEITLTYPNGGEGFVPGEIETLRWDAFGNSGTFNLEYSNNNGATWSNLFTGVAADLRHFNWTVPSNISDRFFIRVTRGAFSDLNDNAFSVLRLPSNLSIDFVCAGFTQLSWNAATGSTAYEISKLGAMYMDSVGTTTGTTFQVPVSDSANTWLSVRSIGANNGKGRRAVAINKSPGLLNCLLSDDLNLTSILNPSPGLLFPCQNLNALIISAAIRNDGMNQVNSFTLSYSINGAAPVSEVYSGTMNHGDNLNFSFATTADLSVPGSYQIELSISYSPDVYLANNTTIINVQVMNAATIPVTEDFDGTLFPPAGWVQTPSGSTYAWAKKSGIIGADGSTTDAAWFDNYSYNSPGSRDYLTSMLADLRGIAAPFLTFDVAYANYSGSSDGLGIEISTDCGANFIPTSYLKAGALLASAPSTSTDWVPTQASQWRKDSLWLSSYVDSLVMLRFVNINDFGNNLYIDNINLENNFNPGVPGQTKPVLISVYPNPASGTLTMDIKNLSSPEMLINILDAGGKPVVTRKLSNTSADFRSSFDVSDLARGIYMIRINNGEKIYNLRVTIL